MIKFLGKYFRGENLVGCEVGVFRGNNAESILSLPFVKKLYLVDPYKVYDDYDDDNMHMIEDAKNLAARRLTRHNSRIQWIYEKFDASLIPERLDFIYIDGSHQYHHVMQDIKNAQKCVRLHGLIGGHDYYPKGHPDDRFGVSRAVREYFNGDVIIAKTKEKCWDWWVL